MSVSLYFIFGALLAGAVLLFKSAPLGSKKKDASEPPVRADSPAMLMDAYPKELMSWIAEQKNLLAWVENAKGEVTWASPTIRKELGSGRDIESVFEILRKPSGTNRGHAQLKPSVADQSTSLSFEVTSNTARDQTVFLAVETIHASEAKTQMSNFVHTMTNTFALLSTGLAIFDKDRQLVMFNPALSNLTKIDPAWLTRKPTLDALLERMRNDQTLGEPKDFKTWRESLPNLVEQAVNGTYEETWHLATGQTYRVVGRPHPHGAIVLLFEDITSEVSAGRRQRLEVEISQNALDAVDEAISVFSHDGTMLIANKHFIDLWGLDPGASLLDITIIQATKIWSEACEPNPVWGDAREFVTDRQNRASWTGEAMRTNGKALYIRFVPMPNGTTLIGFSPVNT